MVKIMKNGENQKIIIFLLCLFLMSCLSMGFAFGFNGDGELKGDYEVQWGHIYPPIGGEYHYHTIGDFAYAANWITVFEFDGLGQILMGGSEGVRSWYCGGQEWWSQTGSIYYEVEVVQVKDETNGTIFTGDAAKNAVRFINCWKRPQGSDFIDIIIDLLWSVVQLKTGFAWPNPFKFLSKVSEIQSDWGRISTMAAGDLSELGARIEFWVTRGFDETHTYTVTCKLTWTASFYICVENGLQSIDLLDPYTVNFLPLDAVDVVYTTFSTYITFKVKPVGA